MDIASATAPGEAVETGLDALIEQRHRRRVEEGERLAHEMYLESVERYYARRRRQNRAAWYSHFMNMADAHAKLSESYEARAEALCQEGAA